MDLDLLRKVYDKILLEPNSHDQTLWISKNFLEEENVCGTTACVAGWAVLLGTQINKERTQRIDWQTNLRSPRQLHRVVVEGDPIAWYIGTLAAWLLDISNITGTYLFSSKRTHEQVVKALEIGLKTEDESEMRKFLETLC